MKSTPLWLALVPLALVAGCAGAPAPAPAARAPAAAVAPPPAPPECHAEAARFAVGQMATAQLEAAAAYRAGASTVRSLRPKQPITLELNSGRLNLTLDARGRVTAVHCG